MLPQSGPALIRFTRSAADGVSPLITAAAAGDSDFWWQGPGGTFVGKQPNIANFPIGAYTLRAKNWRLITSLDWSTRKLNCPLSKMFNPVACRLSGLTYLSLYSNQLTGVLSDVTLPAGLTNLHLGSNQLTGALSDVTLPAGLTNLYLNSNQLTGALSDVTLPVGLVYLYLYGNQLTGALSDVTLPVGLVYLYLYGNQLTGALSDVTLPAGLTTLHLYANQLTGALSDVTLPVGLVYLHLGANQLTGALSDVTLPVGLTTLSLYSNQLTYPATAGSLSTVVTNSCNYQLQDNGMIQGDVNNVLADLVTSGTTGGTLNISGTNASPTDGVNNANRLELVNNRGWTVTVTV